MIHIFHNILWSKYKGGVFSELNSIANGNDIKVYFTQIAESENDRIDLSGVDLSYHRYPYKLLFKGSYSDIPKLLLIKTLFMDVWQSSSEIIILPGYHTMEYWAMLLAGKLRGKTIGVFCDSTAYDRPHSNIKGFFKKLFFSNCDVFLGYGQRSREYLMSYGVPSHKIHFRCQAAALPHDYSVERVFASKAAQQKNDSQRFLYVGRLSPEKNLKDLIDAFKIVTNTLPDAQLRIVGNGPQKNVLEGYVNSLGMQDMVMFTGSKDVPELRDEYLKANVFILPSSSEPWGLVVNEALSYGCPVIVSHRCGCVPELVIEGETGFVFECGNVADLAEKIINSVRTFKDIYATARNCINLISKFSPEAVAQQILDVCHKASGTSK